MSFRLFNQNGLLAFSSEHNNLRFLEKRTVSRVSNLYQLSVSSAFGCPVIFIQPRGSEYLACQLASASNGVYSFRIYASGGAAAPASLDVYIFVADMVAATGYGINVRKADGTIAFSTASRLLKIAGHYMTQAERPSGIAQAQSYALSSGTVPARYAVCIQTHGFAYIPNPYIRNTIVVLLGARVGSSGRLERGGIQTISGFGGLRDGTDLLGPLYIPLIDCSLYG